MVAYHGSMFYSFFSLFRICCSMIAGKVKRIDREKTSKGEEKRVEKKQGMIEADSPRSLCCSAHIPPDALGARLIPLPRWGCS